MRLKNRFKNRFISHQKWVQWFSAIDFRSTIWAILARKERENEKPLKEVIFEAFNPKSGSEEMQDFLDWRVKTGGFISNINHTELYRTKFKEYDLQ